MRRFILLLFVFVLPLQFAWGAAARYCEHESTKAASHMGHHAHKHEQATGAAEQKTASAGAEDPDCGYCHMGCAQPLATQSPSLDPASASVQVSQQPVASRYRAPSLIDRPKWLLAA